jgi:CheY-like chemotaxis protein
VSRNHWKFGLLAITNRAIARSPLHGILGSTEVLKDLDLNSVASTLAGQIDSCGRTLLDIIDHLLDFATLKGQKIGRGVASSAKIKRNISLKGSKTSGNDDLADVETSVCLDDLTEEAVESTVYSFNCKKGIDYEPRTSVILEIDRSPSNRWDCQLATGGWRRICINLITNALKYTPTGFIRVSLDQRPRPSSKRQFDAIFTVTDSGKGMSKDFLDNHLFRDFSQEDTLADGIGLGMHMVGRIVHAIGAKIDVVSEQNGPGAGTTVTVTVPLEHSQSHRKNSLATEALEKSTQVALTGLKARIISNRTPTSPGTTREERLASTASAMAITSLEKNCEALGLQLLGRNSADSDLNFIFENDFEYFVRAQDNNNHHTDISNKPCIVICNSNATGKTVKASRDKELSRLCAAVEYIAMPCGVKTISRAITSAFVRQKELDATTLRPIDESQNPISLEPMRVELGEIEVPPSVDPLASPKEVPVRPKIRSSKSYQGSARLRANSKAHEIPVSESLAQANEHGPADEQQTNGISIPSTSPPKNVAPMLLLVDDNKVNLQLLTMYAKKQGYPYISATDGQMAVDAYSKAHEDSHLPQGSHHANSGSQMPTVILMDINMPIMDGYEATQHIRAYEKKHSIPATTIIALTALGSEAAYQEAFGSGCDMFLTKPVKLKDLTKIIEEM